jgi:hypothetical protein
MIQDLAIIIPQQINIVLWIGVRKSLNRNVLTGRKKESYNQDSFFHLIYLLNFFLSSESGMTPRDSI